jgi:hypothetical protein
MQFQQDFCRKGFLAVFSGMEMRKCHLDSGLHAALAMSGRDGCDARVLQVLQKSQFVAPL